MYSTECFTSRLDEYLCELELGSPRPNTVLYTPRVLSLVLGRVRPTVAPSRQWRRLGPSSGS
jgi:hypothetical protein